MPYTDKQKLAIRQRDGLICRHPNRTIHCGGGLGHIHHISPQRYSLVVLGWTDEQINCASNGIYLCPNHHLGHPNSVHPDVIKANEQYRLGDHEAYEKMFAARNALVDRHQKYWNDLYDEVMAAYALRATMLALRTGWAFPTKTTRTKKNLSVVTMTKPLMQKT